jgi:hypothetical protein
LPLRCLQKNVGQDGCHPEGTSRKYEGQEPREAKIKTGLKEVKTMDLEESTEEIEVVADGQKSLMKRLQLKLLEDWSLAIRHRRWPKDRTLGDGGFQQKSATT